MTSTRVTPPQASRLGLGKVLSVGYAAAGYVSFLAVSVYAVAFLADARVSRTVDHGGPASGTTWAVVIDAALLAVFALQHSVMARPSFKQWWTALVPAHVERATYVLGSSAALALVFWQWRPIPHVVWDVSAPGARAGLWILYGAGWAWVVAMTFVFDHLDLVGLRQVFRHLRGVAAARPLFAIPWSHRLVRHPMMVGFMIAFVATPTMTAGHLLFAALGTGYILVGVRLEEHDLEAALPEYREYAAATPRFIPRPRRDRA